MKRFFAAVLMLALTIPLMGTGTAVPTGPKTWYVTVAGSDSASGLSEGTAFRTFRKALRMAAPGDTVLAGGGVYSERIGFPRSGTDEAPITLRNLPGQVPVLDGTGLVPDDTGMITVMDQSHLVISGFEIRNYVTDDTDRTPMGIYIEGACSDLRVEGCRIHDIRNPEGNAHGIAVYGTDGQQAVQNIRILGNEIFNCRLGESEALVLNGNVDGFQVNGNTVHDNDNIGIDFIGYEGTATANDVARNGECVGNRVYNISSLNNPTYSDPCAGAIYVDGGADIRIDRNHISNSDIGIEVATERGPVTRNITVTNNLITGCRQQAAISFGSAEDAAGGGVEHLKVFNNTLYDNVYAFQVLNADSPTNVIRSNILWAGAGINGSIGRNRFLDNITADPRFVNPAAGNFRLQSGSPAIDAGTEVLTALDLDGLARVYGARIDAGAYEYRPLQDPMPVAAPNKTPR